MANNEPDYNALQGVFTQLGVDYATRDYGSRGVCQGMEYETNKMAGMPREVMRAVAHSIDITDTHFYFDVDGVYLGLVGGDEQPGWEEPQKNGNLQNL